MEVPLTSYPNLQRRFKQELISSNAVAFSAPLTQCAVNDFFEYAYDDIGSYP